MIRHLRQQDLYDEAAAAYSRAWERLVRAYEADPQKQRDLLQEVHFAVWRSFENYESPVFHPNLGVSGGAQHRGVPRHQGASKKRDPLGRAGGD